MPALLFTLISSCPALMSRTRGLPDETANGSRAGAQLPGLKILPTSPRPPKRHKRTAFSAGSRSKRSALPSPPPLVSPPCLSSLLLTKHEDSWGLHGRGGLASCTSTAESLRVQDLPALNSGVIWVSQSWIGSPCLVLLGSLETSGTKELPRGGSLYLGLFQDLPWVSSDLQIFSYYNPPPSFGVSHQRPIPGT